MKKKKGIVFFVKIIVYIDWCQERNITPPLLKMKSTELDQNLARIFVQATPKKGEEYCRSALLVFRNSIERHLNNGENIKKPSISKQQQNSRCQAQNQLLCRQRKYSTCKKYST